MKIPVHIAKQLLHLSKGEIISSGMAKHPLINELIAEGIIEKNGRIQKKLYIQDNQALVLYLQNKYGINDLKKYIEICETNNVQRSDLVEAASDSKLKPIRTFKGFLINSYVPIQATFNGESISLTFTDGLFSFMYDFETFIPEQNVTIIGIENPENFRYIHQQKQLFKGITPLFISRYPQNQNKDVTKWLQSISNTYLHFGDFDFAGIAIYLNEYKKHLLDKARFFVPENIDNLISNFGNKKRYDTQKIHFDVNSINEEPLLHLIHTIHKFKKGLDQEKLIMNIQL